MRCASFEKAAVLIQVDMIYNVLRLIVQVFQDGEVGELMTLRVVSKQVESIIQELKSERSNQKEEE